MTEPYLHEITLKFTQDGDDFCNESQYLNVSLLDAGAGPYLSIETNRWSFNEPKELNRLLKQIQKQCGPLFEMG